MKKYITMRIQVELLSELNRLKKLTRLSRTALIEEAIKVLIQLYTSPINVREIEKIAKKLLVERSDLYKRLANK